MSEIIQLPDTTNSDTELAEFYGWSSAALSAGQFLIIDCPSERAYLGQVIRPQQNFNRDALGPYDNQTVNMLERLHEGRLAREVGVKEVFKYSARLLKDVTTGTPQSVRKRPQIGSIGRAATEEEIIRYLGLPFADDKYRIGSIIDTEVAVCLNRRVFNHHLLVAGSTGSGKSNLLGNAILAAQNLGACIFVFDHKPDYQNVDEVNDEGAEAHYTKLDNVSFWYIGDKGRRQDDQQITVPASALNPAVLAHTICHHHSEHNAAEALTDLLYAYADSKNGNTWSLKNFRSWLPKTADQCASQYDIDIHKSTYSAMLQKLQRSGRVPSWVDGTVAESTRQFFGAKHFDLEELIQPGHVIVIRVDSASGGGRDYGLFLSYILKEVYRTRESSAQRCQIVHVIDEAQDIFNAGKSFQATAGAMLEEHIRKGRSQNIAFVIGVQSAESVPEGIRNNLNSQFILRHNNADQAREAMNRATKEQLAMTNSFGPGESLAFIFGSNSVIHLLARRSPFKLTKLEVE